MAYWEQSNRVGPVTKVTGTTISVVSEQLQQPCNGDICLTSLAAAAAVTLPKLAANASTRSKIGSGILISHEGDAVWVYNRSTQPVFVHSLTILDADSGLGIQLGNSEMMILKLWPGYCMRAYNPRFVLEKRKFVCRL